VRISKATARELPTLRKQVSIRKNQLGVSFCENHSSDCPSSASDQVVYQDDHSYDQQEMNQASAASDP